MALLDLNSAEEDGSDWIEEDTDDLESYELYRAAIFFWVGRLEEEGCSCREGGSVCVCDFEFVEEAEGIFGF